MASLPTVGGDVGAWGSKLNTYVQVGHDASGHHAQWFNVKEYGAVGDGVTDDTNAIQGAITACQTAGGGIVYFPAATYLISSTLTISADNVQLVGAGWGAQLLAKAGWAAGTYMVQVQGPGGAGNFRYGIVISEVFFNGNSLSGVGSLDLVSCYGALINHVRTRYFTGIAVHWDGIGGAFGAYNYMRDCHMTDGIGASAVAVQTDSSEWLTIEAGHIGYYQTAGNVGVKLQNLNNRVIGTSFDYCDTSVVCAFAGRNHIIGCQFDRGWTRFIYLQSAAGCVVANNFFGVRSGSGPEAIRVDGVNNDKSVIVGNTEQAASGWPLFVQEYAGIGGSNTYADNDTGGLGMTVLTGVARGNRGYNPLQSLATPAAPAVAASGSGSTVAPGTYQVEVTLVSETGETAGSVATAVTPTAGQNIVITSPAQAGNAYGWYAYVTQAAGAANTATRQQTAGSPSSFGSNLTLTAPPTNTGATVPASNTTADVTTPAVPASATALQNTTGVDVTVYLTGGTVTAVTIGNKATGLTSGVFRLLARQTIALTYSVAPTWVWIGE